MGKIKYENGVVFTHTTYEFVSQEKILNKLCEHYSIDQLVGMGFMEKKCDTIAHAIEKLRKIKYKRTLSGIPIRIQKRAPKKK